jgi:hypothetical protein
MITDGSVNRRQKALKRVSNETFSTIFNLKQSAFYITLRGWGIAISLMGLKLNQMAGDKVPHSTIQYHQLVDSNAREGL